MGTEYKTGVKTLSRIALDAGMNSRLDSAAELAALPFRLVEEAGVACGYERSVKLLDGRILANRYLLGIDTADAPRDRLLAMCRRLGMPDDYVERFEDGLPEANLVFLGFEDNESNCVFKVYLEFWEKQKARIAADSGDTQPGLLHVGYKWRAGDDAVRAVTQYMWRPRLSVADMLAQLRDIYRGHAGAGALEIASGIVELAASRGDGRSFRYLEVAEEGNPRKSFDINLYGGALILNDIRPFVLRKCRDFSIPEELPDRLFRLDGAKRFGHISGGVGRGGEDFLTIYYEG